MTHRRTATGSPAEPEPFQHAEGLDDAGMSRSVLHPQTGVLLLSRAAGGRVGVISRRQKEAQVAL